MPLIGSAATRGSRTQQELLPPPGRSRSASGTAPRQRNEERERRTQRQTRSQRTGHAAYQSRSPRGRPRRGPKARPPYGRRHLAAWLNRNRRLAIALLLCLAAGIAVNQLTPASEYRVAVLAAARDLPAGTTVAPGDLTTLHVPAGVSPGGSFNDSASLQGKQLASPLRSGQIPTDAQVLGPGLLTGAPPGAAAIPLRMADPSSVQLLGPGQLVNVVLTPSGAFEEAKPSEVLAVGVPVLWTSAQGGKAGQWLGTNETDGLVVVAADPAQAGRLAGASTRGKLFFVLVNAS